ncbi:MAG TPA: alpha/beta fold hydrolase [Chloroflexota bacterium]|nr:alpha/beta fold hydrolase [Chloroflexota bacterium]
MELAPFTAAPYGAVIRGVRGGTGPPALLLHGTAGSWRNFDAWLPALLPRASVVIPDLPGCGDSPAPALRPRLRTWARLLHALMTELAPPPRILVGLGMGASLALAYLQVAPPAARAALTHVVLHTPAYCPAAIRPAFCWGVPLLTAGPVFAVVQRLLRRPDVLDWYVQRFVAGPDVPAADVRLLSEDLRRASLPVLAGLARDMVRADFRPLLQGCATPLLALVAENDPFVYPAVVARLATLMPAARVVVQRDVGHGWTPAAIAEQQRLLAEFLAKPPGRPAG